MWKNVTKSMKVEGKDTQNSSEPKPQTVLPDSTTDTGNKFYYGPIVESEEDSDDDTQSTSINLGSHDIKDQLVTNTQNTEVVNKLNVLQHVFNATSSSQTLGTVFVKGSNGVQVGNVTYVTGPIHFVCPDGNRTRSPTCWNEPTCSTDQMDTAKTSSSSEAEKIFSPAVRPDISKDGFVEKEVEIEEVNRSDAFLGNIHRAIDGSVLRIVNRMTWLAQRPLEPYDYLGAPAQYVIISHTATQDGTTQAENVYLVRNIQCFHIESRRWNDVSYNFLIGGDGNVYEGRGWNVVGAHTHGYNKKSVGISFIGCFMKVKAAQISIKACKLLIKRGVELGHIHPNYTLLAHCQCSATESPGRMLFEEIQTWPHFVLHPKI